MTEREQFEAWGGDQGYPLRRIHDEADQQYLDLRTQGAWEAWQAARAQPAQAVPASCGECGKKTSDGWALYCVACMEEAGLPAVTDSPPLTHSCTSSLGKTPDSTAQAGKVLTDDQWQRIADITQSILTRDTRDEIEAVLAKRVPQWRDIETAPKDGTPILLARDHRVTAGHWEPERYPTATEYHSTTGEYLGQFETGEVIDAWWYSEDGGFDEENHPTHWMPLPPPPGIVGKEGGNVLE